MVHIAQPMSRLCVMLLLLCLCVAVAAAASELRRDWCNAAVHVAVLPCCAWAWL
jgi:hypothetical protein